MKSWLSSFLLPCLLIVLLSIFTLWFNKITLLTEKLPSYKYNPTTTMYNANIRNFNLQGQLEDDIRASEISQTKNSNLFLLTDAKILRYKEAKIIQSVTAKQATFNNDTKHFKLTGKPKTDTEDGRVEIIINEL